jgi:hypothetical protein
VVLVPGIPLPVEIDGVDGVGGVGVRVGVAPVHRVDREEPADGRGVEPYAHEGESGGAGVDGALLPTEPPVAGSGDPVAVGVVVRSTLP